MTGRTSHRTAEITIAVDALPFARGMERAGLSMAYLTFRIWANTRRWSA
jgi:hypothetical protein